MLFDPEDTEMAVPEGATLPEFSVTRVNKSSLSPSLSLCLLEVGFCNLYLKEP